MQTLAPRSIALLAITAIAVYLCWLMVEPFFQVIVWAAVLAIVSYPVYQRFIRWGRGPTVSAILTTLLVVLTVVVPLTLLGLALVNEVTDAIPRVRAGITKLLESDMLKPESAVRQWVERYFGVESLDADFIASRLNSLGAVVAKETVGIVGDMFGTAVQGFFVLFTLYYMLRDADRIIGATRDFVPLEREQADRILRQTHEIISASLHGVLSIAGIQGALGCVAFWVLGLGSPLLWGVVMFFMSMIPMAGSFIVWVPASIYLLVTGHWVKALILALWGGLVIGTIDNFLRPRFVGQKTRLHELVVLFSVLGGLKVFGVLGIVVGPVVVAITMALIDVLRQANAAERRTSDPTGAVPRPDERTPPPPAELDAAAVAARPPTT